MKSKNKVKFLLILGILLSILAVFSNIFPKILIKSQKQIESITRPKLKNAGYWDLTGTPIFIDDSDPNFNWSKTATDNDWCDGTGTWNDPYIIENVTIDGQNTNSCITIENSNVFFVIRYCYLSNSGSEEAGINLNNVNNSFIFNNTLYSNDSCGILNRYCENASIQENNIYLNPYYGINTYYSDDIVITDNTITGVAHGIVVEFSSNHTINNNIIQDNTYYGILIRFCDIVYVDFNTMLNCGILCEGATVSQFNSYFINTSNLVNGKPYYYYKNEKNLNSLNFSNAGQINLINCSDSLIKEILVQQPWIADFYG